jgi:hypothetical protein
MQLLSELDGDYIKVSRFSQHLVGFPILFRYINQSILPRSVLLQRSTNFRYQSLSRRCSQDEDPAEIPSHSVAQHVFAKKLDSKLHGTWSISRGPSKTNTISQKCIHDGRILTLDQCINHWPLRCCVDIPLERPEGMEVVPIGVTWLIQLHYRPIKGQMQKSTKNNC